MSNDIKNVLVLTHDGYFIAELVGGGVRVAKQQGKCCDFTKGDLDGRRLAAIAASASINDIRTECTRILASAPALQPKARGPRLKDGDADWRSSCDVCGQKPTVHPTGSVRPLLLRRGRHAWGNW